MLHHCHCQGSWTAADNSEQDQLVVFGGPGNASQRCRRAASVIHFTRSLEIGIMTFVAKRMIMNSMSGRKQKLLHIVKKDKLKGTDMKAGVAGK